MKFFSSLTSLLATVSAVHLTDSNLAQLASMEESKAEVSEGQVFAHNQARLDAIESGLVMVIVQGLDDECLIVKTTAEFAVAKQEYENRKLALHFQQSGVFITFKDGKVHEAKWTEGDA